MGGGLFERTARLQLNFFSAEPHPDFPLPNKFKTTTATSRLPGDMPIYARRLERDGWVLQPEGSFATTDWQWGKDWRWGKALTWQKTQGDYALVMEWQDDEYHYALLHNKNETLLEGITWADWDQHGRLVGAMNGAGYCHEPRCAQ